VKRYFFTAVFIFVGTITFSQDRVETPVFSTISTSEVMLKDYINNDADKTKIALNAKLLNIPKTTSVSDIAYLLTGTMNSQTEMVRSIYSWIALHINYDSTALFTGNVPDQSPEAILQRRNAVCEGYARLFVSMCKSIGIESRMIKGFVREEEGNFQFPNHAWNSVLIDGKWQLLDVTWGGLYYQTALQGNASHPLNQLSAYLFPDPKSLVLTHLPEDPYWQLQSDIVSLKDFITGEEYVKSSLINSPAATIDFENLIAGEEKLDSLDRQVNFLTRMVSAQDNGSREYALAITYYYKAQRALKNAECCNNMEVQKLRSMARQYYKKALAQLELLDENDYEFEFSKDLAVNVSQRMMLLQ
jgi:hypothetical protein